jgi:hypothetical protein
MSSDIRSSHSVLSERSTREQILDWILLEGSRRLLAVVISLLAAGSIGVLIFFDVLAVGPGSSMATLLGSGIVGGLITLLTIALSINQLIISRVSHPIESLADRPDGARELREDVETLVDRMATPNDPAAFLSLIATEVTARSETLLGLGESSEWDPPAELRETVENFQAYGSSIDDNLEKEMAVSDTLNVIIGPEYAFNITAVSYLQEKYAETLPAQAKMELQGIEDSLESIAVVLQFYKAVAHTQVLARLSRLLGYSGLGALLYAIALALIYRSGSVTVPSNLVPALVTFGTAVIVLPLALFVSFLLRSATIARETVSVGPFVPPQ